MKTKREIQQDATTTNCLISETRSHHIIEMVRASGFLTIDSLAEHFCVTPQTIRRVVNRLCDYGLLKRRHGGVEPPAPERNLAYQARQVLNLDEKQCIARRLAADIPERASLFFGIGTTPEQCAVALANHAHLKIMTNNLNVAMILCHNPACEITIAGGRIRNQDRDVIAGEAHQFFDRYSVDIGIFGVGGVAEDGSLLDFSPDEAAMRRSLMQHCRQRYLVLDHSKFGRKATVRSGHLGEASAIYTDLPIPENIATQLTATNVRLVICTAPHSDCHSVPTLYKPQGD